MAKSSLAIVPKKSAMPIGQRKEAPEARPPELPAHVDEILFEIQTRLLRVKAVFASAYALAETNDDSGDVRWALEAALELFEPVIESVEPICVREEAAKREVSRG